MPLDGNANPFSITTNLDWNYSGILTCRCCLTFDWLVCTLGCELVLCNLVRPAASVDCEYGGLVLLVVSLRCATQLGLLLQYIARIGGSFLMVGSRNELNCFRVSFH